MKKLVKIVKLAYEIINGKYIFNICMIEETLSFEIPHASSVTLSKLKS